MDEPDLFAWLQDWRWNTGHDAQTAEALPQVEPLALQIGDTWMALSATPQADTIRVDVLIEPELEHEVAPWIWLYTGYLYTGQQPYVEGFVPNPTGSLYSLGQVSLNR